MSSWRCREAELRALGVGNREAWGQARRPIEAPLLPTPYSLLPPFLHSSTAATSGNSTSVNPKREKSRTRMG
jgi:hypothetical protein